MCLWVTELVIPVLKGFNYLIGNYWRVTYAEFPYNSGYATYNKFQDVIWDSGLSEEEALKRCEQLNKEMYE